MAKDGWKRLQEAEEVEEVVKDGRMAKDGWRRLQEAEEVEEAVKDGEDWLETE